MDTYRNQSDGEDSISSVAGTSSDSESDDSVIARCQKSKINSKRIFSDDEDDDPPDLTIHSPSTRRSMGFTKYIETESESDDTLHYTLHVAVQDINIEETESSADDDLSYNGKSIRSKTCGSFLDESAQCSGNLTADTMNSSYNISRLHSPNASSSPSNISNNKKKSKNSKTDLEQSVVDHAESERSLSVTDLEQGVIIKKEQYLSLTNKSADQSLPPMVGSYQKTSSVNDENRKESFSNKDNNIKESSITIYNKSIVDSVSSISVSSEESIIDKLDARDLSYSPQVSTPVKTGTRKKISTPVNSTIDDDSVEIVNNSDNEIEIILDSPEHTPVLKSLKKLPGQMKITSMFPRTPKTIESKPQTVKKVVFVSQKEYDKARAELDNRTKQWTQMKMALKLANNLPDKGAKLKENVEVLYNSRREQAEYVALLVVKENDEGSNKSLSSNWELDMGIDQIGNIGPKTFGERAINTFANQKTLTLDRLKDLHGSLDTCPKEDELAESPYGLKLELMQHQRRAIAWLLWRERQKPRGGILADDMGLGKTLTMISLVLKAKELEEDSNVNAESDSDDGHPAAKGWIGKGRQDFKPGGTLVICPASLLKQWEAEIESKCKSNLLSVHLHHGVRREETSRKMLARQDVVISTYGVVLRENPSGNLFRVRWNRIILDEAHAIRNHKGKTSIAVCALKAKYRWALTGTPIQNKENDLYPLLKFLRCSPFDDLHHWKTWISNKSAGGQQRLNALMRTLMLRRTKVQLQENGTLLCLPVKNIHLLEVNLDKEEMNVYQKVLVFSQTLFAQFLHQKAEHGSDLAFSREGRPAFLKTNDPNGAYSRAHQQMLKMHGGNKAIQTFEILVLLLRLRQICSHCCLINAMLDQENYEEELENDNVVDIDLLQQLDKLTLEESLGESEEVEINTKNILSSSNPVFSRERKSSKLQIVLSKIQEIVNSGDKAVIVSQWTSMLDIVQEHIAKLDIRTITLSGKVPVKDRNDIVETFNKSCSDAKVMLLSLTAGGVGLNLVGGNHLLLLDLHWNPQLEAQAQDRIYRVGQKKPVHIYKFMTMQTVEERIKALQDNKLELADSVLTGAKHTQGSKLSMDELRQLFEV